MRAGLIGRIAAASAIVGLCHCSPGPSIDLELKLAKGKTLIHKRCSSAKQEKGTPMKRSRWIMVLSLTAILLGFTISRSAEKTNPATLLIRCDDIGMCHAVNMACKQLIESGVVFSASVMFPCPWYQEAVDLLKENPQISVGVHLTLNAEWTNYRWGPIIGRQAAASLIDSCGHFWPSRASFIAHSPKIEEVEAEMRAQIERALTSGLRIDYLDHHMSTIVETPELRELLEKLAKEYNLGISRYFGENTLQGIYAVPIEEKSDSLLTIIDRLQPGGTYLLVFHIGRDEPELQAMKDLNSFGLPQMSRHRQAELHALCSPDWREKAKQNQIELITYRDLIAQKTTAGMSRPQVQQD